MRVVPTTAATPRRALRGSVPIAVGMQATVASYESKLDGDTALGMFLELRSVPNDATVREALTMTVTGTADPVAERQALAMMDHPNIARVLDAALTQMRPVYLEIPRDMPGRPCAAVPRTPPVVLSTASCSTPWPGAPPTRRSLAT